MEPNYRGYIRSQQMSVSYQEIRCSFHKISSKLCFPWRPQSISVNDQEVVVLVHCICYILIHFQNCSKATFKCGRLRCVKFVQVLVEGRSLTCALNPDVRRCNYGAGYLVWTSTRYLHQRPVKTRGAKSLFRLAKSYLSAYQRSRI